MKYEIKHNENTYQVDDLLMLDRQSKEFQVFASEAQKQSFDGGCIINTDNATLMIYSTGRVLVALTEESEVNNG
ncbi:hypothetical protein M2132_000816 [Dysgonomonas sp. PH5-45]|uniref:hypothetical protein n=1 Tax=unclassified Dysgonomonas TaxID=2630389 RepID=UPI002473D458|nr:MULTISPECIES: hypothetical protein [unclassified Dysgonomonas]MDH6354488.1 hypothetical protein [Dysgonomonas sp. PH5-45]MDH6387455.1 hypothetical protein [Dysgonomonas sp. PH5-37]